MGGLCGASLFPSDDGRRRGGFFEISNTALARKMGLSQVVALPPLTPQSGSPDSRTDAQTTDMHR